MKAISKRGKVFSERFAKTAIRIGIATEVIEGEEEKPKKGRKPKK